MKTCRKCNTTKSLEEFGNAKRNKDGKQSYCRKCANQLTIASRRKRRAADSDYLESKRAYENAQKAQYRAEMKKMVVDRLGGKCVSCGFTPASREEMMSLHLDHIDPATKSANVSDLIGRSRQTRAILEEADKCQLLCLPCHMNKTVLSGDVAKGKARRDSDD